MSKPTKRTAAPHTRPGEPLVEEPFLKRWSRRKTLSAHGEPPPALVAEQTPAPAEPLTDEDMPALDSLNEHSDYGGFLSPKVSDELRKLALRKLFHGAGFNICDGLDDYDEDMTVFEPLGDIITSDLRHRMELEREAEQAADAKTQSAQAEVECDGEPQVPIPEGDDSGAAAPPGPEHCSPPAAGLDKEGADD